MAGGEGGQARTVLATTAHPATGAALWQAAAAGGAAALGQPAPALRLGAPADLVALDADHTAFAGVAEDGWLDAWIFAARAGAIDRVWRGGVKYVDAGRHRDKPRLVARYRAALTRLLAA